MAELHLTHMHCAEQEIWLNKKGLRKLRVTTVTRDAILKITSPYSLWTFSFAKTRDTTRDSINGPKSRGI